MNLIAVKEEKRNTCLGCYFAGKCEVGDGNQTIDGIKYICSRDEIIYKEKPMNKKEQALKELEEIEKRTAELKKIITEEDTPKLHLKADTVGGLLLEYKDNMIGWLSKSTKKLRMVGRYLSTYDKWVEDGKPTDHSPIEWNGGEYTIGSDYVFRRTDIPLCGIYDLTLPRPMSGCEDENVLRRGRNTPVIF